MLRPKGDFWIEHYRRQADYERGTFTAKVTAVYSDGVYDVETASGLSGGQFYDVSNTTPFNFVVGAMVIVARVGGGRGNRHVIIARAGAGSQALPYAPAPSPGAEPDYGDTLSEVIDARDSAVYGAKASLDARLEAGDSEVEDARQGYGSLSDRIAAKADLSSPQFTGTPRAERYEVHDGTKYITFDGGANLTLTDGVTGTKTLSELAATGGSGTPADTVADLDGSGAAGAATTYQRGDHKHGDSARHARLHSLSSGAEHSDWPAGLTPTELGYVDGVTSAIQTQLNSKAGLGSAKALAPRVPGQAGTAATASRSDHQHPDFAWQCEAMLDLVLRNQLDTKPGTAKAYSDYYSFNSVATANNGIGTWSGANWLSTTTYRYTSTAAEYYEQYFVGEKVKLWRGNLVGNVGTGAVTIDGAAHGTWDQTEETGSPSYEITGLTYGVHYVRVTRATGELHIGLAHFWQWPYPGCGVSGDAVEIEYLSPFVHCTTIGTGPTNNGGAFPNRVYGEAMTPRLPLTTLGAADTVFTRSIIGIGASVNPGYARLSIDAESYQPIVCGLTITLGSGGAVRGCRPTTSSRLTYARDLSAAIITHSFVPFIGRVTATGAGSVLTVGELVFGVTVSCAGAAQVTVAAAVWNASWCAVDFYKLPATLL